MSSSPVELVARHTEEVLTEDDLAALVAAGTPRRHYIGFEISGQVHLGTGLVCMSKIRDFVEAGFECRVLLADWHSWINDKLGGDLGRIRDVAQGYFRFALERSLEVVGADPARVEFVLASDLYEQRADYWPTVLQVAKNTSLARMQRSITILGREEGAKVDFAKLIYPAMQVADVFVLDAHLAHAGLDQRKAHAIARDVANALTLAPLSGDGPPKPVAVHHPLLMGLGKPPAADAGADQAEARRAQLLAMKMSKSKPETAVFIHDAPEEIERKLTGAYCPPKDAELNPVLNWVEALVFRALRQPTFEVDRPEKFGGAVSYSSHEELVADYTAGGLHPMDLKKALAAWLVETLAPVREAFAAAQVRGQLDVVRANTTS